MGSAEVCALHARANKRALLLELTIRRLSPSLAVM